jgi:hypothetical protein
MPHRFMQTFDTEPTELQLAALLEPEGYSLYLDIEDTTEKLIAHPLGMPTWVYSICILGPCVIGIATVINEFGRHGINFLFLLFLVAGLITPLFLFPLCSMVNRKYTERGDFFILDKLEKSLSLPRNGTVIPHDRVCRFVELHAWHIVDDSEGRQCNWLSELSVIVRTDDTKLCRYPVVSCLYRRRVHELGETLSQFFKVELQVMKLDIKTRRCLKLEKPA